MPIQTTLNPDSASWLNHIRAPAVDIGPRGPTREGERHGALYAQAAFKKMGLKPTLETFTSARSIFHPHILGSSLMLSALIGIQPIYAHGNDGVGSWLNHPGYFVSGLVS